MAFEILIPVKRLDHGKSRLAPVLSAADRAAFCAHLLQRTLAIAASIAPACIVTSDQSAAAMAIQAGSRVLMEPVGLDMNAALDWGRKRVAAGLLVMPLDLPYLTPEAIARLVRDGKQVAVATDRRRCGTNLLYLPKAVVQHFGFAYGENSAAAHCVEAARLGWRAEVVALPEAEFDVDLPVDYEEYASSPHVTGSPARRALSIDDAYGERASAGRGDVRRGRAVAAGLEPVRRGPVRSRSQFMQVKP